MSEDFLATLPDGRALGCRRVGVPSGPVVFHQHGGPSSRLEVDLFADAATRAGLCVIGIDRPGIGRSTPHPGRTLLQWADDVRALADALAVERFAVTGWSEGGPYALACAAGIPADRLVRTISVAGGSYGAFGDNWAAPLQNPVDRLGGWLCLHLHPGFRLMYDALAWEARHFPASYLAQVKAAVNDDDRACFDDPAVAEAFVAATRECFRQGTAGLIEDATLLYRDWGLDFGRIAGPVDFWQGGDDRLVPAAINRPVAAAIPNATWHEVPGAGHCVILHTIERIFSLCRQALPAL
ncbi:MAG: alpha/beta hydrolase [Proteobacteria bacterium]|nr:alpha/beta hydrolase [Pseudomonadota bacterium]